MNDDVFYLPLKILADSNCKKGTVPEGTVPQQKNKTCYGVNTPPVEMVYVVVPDVPTVPGVAAYE